MSLFPVGLTTRNHGPMNDFIVEGPRALLGLQSISKPIQNIHYRLITLDITFGWPPFVAIRGAGPSFPTSSVYSVSQKHPPEIF